LVFRIRLDGSGRAGVSGKDVANETVMIHRTPKPSRLSGDHSEEREGEEGKRGRGRKKEEERNGRKKRAARDWKDALTSLNPRGPDSGFFLTRYTCRKSDVFYVQR
jgi:hypothetical protein